MNTDTISPIELPENLIPERMRCYTCKRRPRVIVFPPWGGSFLDVNCAECEAASKIFLKLEQRGNP